MRQKHDIQIENLWCIYSDRELQLVQISIQFDIIYYTIGVRSYPSNISNSEINMVIFSHLINSTNILLLSH